MGEPRANPPSVAVVTAREGRELEVRKDVARVMMPMLPSGVTMTLAVDVAAVGIALTEAGVRVAAATFSAAHCKVNVSVN